MTPPRRLLACTAVAAVLGGTLATVHALSPAAESVPVSTPGPDATRFLNLTGATPTGPMALPQDTEAVKAGYTPQDCGRSTATIAQLPNGWCLSPAGSQVDVLRFPMAS